MATKLQALSTLRASMIAFDADKTAELLVDILIKTDSLYHFDDDPATIYCGANIEVATRTFTDEESKILREIVGYCHSSPKLFELAIKHVENA